MDGVLGYLRNLVLAAFILALIKALFTDSFLKRLLSFACGLVFVILAISPFSRIDTEGLAQMISRFRIAEFQNETGIAVNNNELISQLIMEKSQAYILDKAKALHIDIKSVTVEMETGGQYPYPVGACLYGTYTEQQRIELTSWIEQNLAIPESALKWKWK